jgi:hypothetical protein
VNKAKEENEAEFTSKASESEQAKAKVEAEHKEKIEKLHSQNLFQEVVAQKRIDQLLASRGKAAAAKEKARAKERSLRQELEAVQERVAVSASPSDWKALKSKVKALQADCIDNARSETKSKINSLKGELRK